MVEASRPAVEADLPRLAELIALGEAELRPMRGGEVWASARPPLDLVAELDDPDRLVQVGTIDDAVVGYARSRRTVLADGRVVGTIEDLFVEPGAREVGLGEAMMDAVLEWCRAKGCSGVDAIALPGHRATKNFFEESGFTARLLVMHRSLDA